MKEANADIALVENGFRTRTEIRRERFGDEWSDVVKKLAEEKKMMEELDVLPQSMTPPPAPVLPDEAGDSDKPEEKKEEPKDGE